MTKYTAFLRDNPYRIDLVVDKHKSTLVDLTEEEFDGILRQFKHKLTLEYTHKPHYGDAVVFREFEIYMDENATAMMLLKLK